MLKFSKVKDTGSKQVKYVLIVLRVIIGGHLFFSGLVKLLGPAWSAKFFLEGSYGVFGWMSTQPHLVYFVDLLNIWILIFIGAALIVGLFERVAALSGILLLGLYYLAYIPLNPASVGASGGYGPSFLVNPLLIEIVALLMLFLLPTGKAAGLGRLISFQKKEKTTEVEVEKTAAGIDRRELVKSLATIPFVVVFSVPFLSRKFFHSVDATTGATALGKADVFRKEYERLKILDLARDSSVLFNRKNMPVGMIGGLQVSRLIAGNRIISGDYCARDLRYVSKLAALYNTEDRILMTLKSMESSGINTLFLTFRNFQDYQLLNYWKEWGGSMQWISELQTSNVETLAETIERNLMLGASALCLSRKACDHWVANSEYDKLLKALDIAKQFNVPVGIGGYYNETFTFAVDQKIQVDFFFKSFHKDNYWSAHPKPNRSYMEVYDEATGKQGYFHDNFWCSDPEGFAELMKNTNIPWIAFKTNAAGAIPTQGGFEYAIERGAGFVCCSMYDFEIGDSVRSLKRAYLNR